PHLALEFVLYRKADGADVDHAVELFPNHGLAVGVERLDLEYDAVAPLQEGYRGSTRSSGAHQYRIYEILEPVLYDLVYHDFPVGFYLDNRSRLRGRVGTHAISICS